MSTLPEQFSEARTLQLETQFNFFRTFTGKAFESAEKIIALNIGASRASFEKSAALMRQMVAIKDPRDLFALSGQTQSQFDSALAYGRELFGITAGIGAMAPAAAAPEAAPLAPTPAASQAPAVVMPPPELVVVEAPAPAPIAEPTPVAKAAGAVDALPKPSAASFPVPSSAKPIAVTQVKPVDAEPPHAPVSGTPAIVAQKAEAVTGKPPRKK
jgi:phasin family protein